MEKKETHIMYGFGIGIAIVLCMLVFQFTGAMYSPTKQWLVYLTYIPFLIGLILNARAFAMANNNYVTFGNVFLSCFKACMIVAIVMAAWAFISDIIFPETKERILAMMREQMQKTPNVSDELMDKTMDATRKYWTVGKVSIAVFSNLFYGAILSLIAAAIPQKKGPAPMAADTF